MSDISERQKELLRAIVDEYIETASPVGSESIVKKHSLGVSPATIRNEMAALLEDGYLEMMHTSSGRVPTSRAFRYFVEELMEEEEMPVLQEVAVKQRLWPQSFEFEKLLRNAALSLSEITKNTAIAVTEDGYITHAGSVHLLDNEEFWDIEVTRSALNLLDNFDELFGTFSSLVQDDDDVSVAVGDEINYPNMGQAALVFSPFRSGGKAGYVSVLGPSRMNYSFVVPCIRYTKNLIQELSVS